MRRLAFVLATSLLSLALLAPMAMAHDGGQGTYGEIDDKITTNAGFIVIAFFPLFIFAMSMLQSRLEKRKAQRLTAKRHRENEPDWGGGW